MENSAWGLAQALSIYIQADQLAKGRLCWGMSDVASIPGKCSGPKSVIRERHFLSLVEASCSWSVMLQPESWILVPTCIPHSPILLDISSVAVLP